jgi:DNA-binding CsgD family transcriptional regulator
LVQSPGTVAVRRRGRIRARLVSGPRENPDSSDARSRLTTNRKNYCWSLGGLADAFRERAPHVAGVTIAPTITLTPREKQVATLLAYGYTNAQIAQRLSISIRTAEMHRAGAMRKLRAPSRAHIVRWALDHELLR